MNRVHITWERRPGPPAADALRRVVVRALDRLGESAADVSLVLTGTERIRELNRGYRGVDRPTDVLSFPDGDELPDGRRLLGEIIISIDEAKAQAARAGHPLVRELEELALHGVLHLVGYDHEADDGEMNRLELDLRKDLLP